MQITSELDWFASIKSIHTMPHILGGKSEDERETIDIEFNEQKAYPWKGNKFLK